MTNNFKIAMRQILDAYAKLQRQGLPRRRWVIEGASAYREDVPEGESAFPRVVETKRHK